MNVQFLFLVIQPITTLTTFVVMTEPVSPVPLFAEVLLFVLLHTHICVRRVATMVSV